MRTESTISNQCFGWMTVLVVLVWLGAACSSSVSGNGSNSSSGGPIPEDGHSGPADGGTHDAGDVTPMGATHQGEYNLGPVVWSGGQWSNSCGPYALDVQTYEGQILAGTGVDYNGQGQLCDACIKITTPSNRSVVARVVTTGSTTGASDLDLSQVAFNNLTTGEYPRTMNWQVVECSNSGNLIYQFKDDVHSDWTALWVRNPRLPIKKVEVKSGKHAEWFSLTRVSDGSFEDLHGFGTGSFTLRVTATDGQAVTDTFPAFQGIGLLWSSNQFK